MKDSITVGIPAYNEEKSIKNTLNSILSQKISGFSLNSIVVYSDGSTDKTISLVRTMHKENISVIFSTKRQGKTHAIKELLLHAKKERSQFLVLIDADLRIDNNSIIQILFNNIVANKNLIAVSGYRKPLKPKNLMQEIGYFGFRLWEYVITRSGEKEVYFRSSDSVMILRVNEFSQQRISHYSFMHDEFYYLYAKKHNKHSGFDKGAFAYYLLPATIHDYINQMTRYVSRHLTEKEQSLLGKGYTISLKDRLHALSVCIRHNYRIGFYYFLLQSYIQIKSHFFQTTFNDLWIQIISTK